MTQPTLAHIPNSFRLEYEKDRYLTFDILEWQLLIEGWVTDNQRGKTHQLLAFLVNQVEERFGTKISTTTAYNLMVGVRAAFELHKKKLSESLVSLFGTESTQPNSTPSNSENSKPTSENTSPKEAFLQGQNTELFPPKPTDN